MTGTCRPAHYCHSRAAIFTKRRSPSSRLARTEMTPSTVCSAPATTIADSLSRTRLQRRRLGRGERERAPGVRGRGPMRIARAPEKRAARLAEAIERADEREVPQRLLLEAGACCEVVETLERTAAPALLDDRLRLRIAESLHALEAKPDVV